MKDVDERIRVGAQGCLAVAIAAVIAALAGLLAYGLTGSFRFGLTYAIAGFAMAAITNKLEPYMAFVISMFWPVILVIAIIVGIRRAS